jgi:hypothetical protein
MFKPLVLLFSFYSFSRISSSPSWLFRRRANRDSFRCSPLFPGFPGFDVAAPSTPLSNPVPRYAAVSVQAEQIPLAQLRFFKLRTADAE